MPPKKGKGKKKAKLRKFNLDLFGLQTFTRYYGEPFEDFMYTTDKKQQKDTKKDKKKRKKNVVVPKLPKFPPVPEDNARLAKYMRETKTARDEPDYIIPTPYVRAREKTTSDPFDEGGSISEVMCGHEYPLPPRPLPHGGVYGDLRCAVCKAAGGFLKTNWGRLPKKFRKLLNTQFEKARTELNWLLDRMSDAMFMYQRHMKNIVEELRPIVDAMDKAEWEDHFKAREVIDEWREMQKQMDNLRLELKKFRKNKTEEIANAIAEKLKELEELEKNLQLLEKRIQETTDMFNDWQNNSDKKIIDIKAEIEATIELLKQIREGIFKERDNLRKLLNWESRVATEQAVEVMEEIIRRDLDIVLSWLHPAWLRLYLENKTMQQERNELKMENHLLELEVDTMQRQVEKLEMDRKRVEGTKTHIITPPQLQGKIDKYFKNCGDYAIIQSQECPTTRLLYEHNAQT